jgi:hypothetical protein
MPNTQSLADLVSVTTLAGNCSEFLRENQTWVQALNCIGLLTITPMMA